MTDPTVVPAFGEWKNNAELIAGVAHLQYLKPTDRVLDCTYGTGRFWTRWRPRAGVVGTDLNPNLCGGSPVPLPRSGGIDFRCQPWADDEFDVTVFDPPYRLNGRPDPVFDTQWGTHIPTKWQDRMQLIRDGLVECLRVTKPKGYVLLKCQDQVCSGKVRWQTIDFTNHAAEHGGEMVDRLHMLGGRPQPPRTRKAKGVKVKSRQHHARNNASTLLVIQKRVR